jgi:hypothetical protein
LKPAPVKAAACQREYQQQRDQHYEKRMFPETRSAPVAAVCQRDSKHYRVIGRHRNPQDAEQPGSFSPLRGFRGKPEQKQEPEVNDNPFKTMKLL